MFLPCDPAGSILTVIKYLRCVKNGCFWIRLVIWGYGSDSIGFPIELSHRVMKAVSYNSCCHEILENCTYCGYCLTFFHNDCWRLTLRNRSSNVCMEEDKPSITLSSQEDGLSSFSLVAAVEDVRFYRLPKGTIQVSQDDLLGQGGFSGVFRGTYIENDTTCKVSGSFSYLYNTISSLTVTGCCKSSGYWSLKTMTA
jgi:hypothetical protein